MDGVTVIDHPLIQHHLCELRSEKTDPETFRRALSVVASLMVYESTRTLARKTVTVRTPMASARGERMRSQVLLVPVLRAGLGMLFSILPMIPQARVGFIGLKRNEKSLKAHAYLESLPATLSRFEILLIDPMLATGGSAVSALKRLHSRRAKRIRLVSLVAAPEGIDLVRRRFPQVPIYTAVVDQGLDRRGFIVPGLGDAGDRIFGVA